MPASKHRCRARYRFPAFAATVAAATLLGRGPAYAGTLHVTASCAARRVPHASAGTTLTSQSYVDLRATRIAGMGRGTRLYEQVPSSGAAVERLSSRAWLPRDPSSRGPFPIATEQITYTYESESAPVDVYHAATGESMPQVILLPSGTSGGPENHVGHGEHLASWGYAVGVVHNVAFVDSTDIAPNAGRASAALDALRAMPALQGRLSDRAAVVGTHYNGMSAQSATNHDPRFKAMVGLHPALFPYGNGGPEVTVPVLIMGGNHEGGILCPYARSWQTLYHRTGSEHKAVFLFPDANPSDFQEPAYDSPFNFCGAPRESPFPWIRGLMTGWLEYYLRGDPAYYEAMYGEGGQPRLAPETSDAIAENAPQDLEAQPVGESGAMVTWRASITDTTILAGYDLLYQKSDGARPTATAEFMPVSPSARAGSSEGMSPRASHAAQIDALTPTGPWLSEGPWALHSRHPEPAGGQRRQDSRGGRQAIDRRGDGDSSVTNTALVTQEQWELVAQPDLDVSSSVLELEVGKFYLITLAYRDNAGRRFQTAVPVEVQGGAPTPTPTRTRRPTNTPQPTRTATPSQSPTPSATSTPTELPFGPRAYLPVLKNDP